MSDNLVIDRNLIEQVKDLFPPFEPLPPKCFSINGFGVEPQPDGSIKIFSTEGQELVTLLRDENGCIVGYEDHVNQQSVAITDESYFCSEVEDDTFGYDTWQLTQNASQRFAEEAPQNIVQPERLSETKLEKVETESLKLDSSDDSVGGIGGHIGLGDISTAVVAIPSIGIGSFAGGGFTAGMIPFKASSTSTLGVSYDYEGVSHEGARIVCAFSKEDDAVPVLGIAVQSDIQIDGDRVDDVNEEDIQRTRSLSEMEQDAARTFAVASADDNGDISIDRDIELKASEDVQQAEGDVSQSIVRNEPRSETDSSVAEKSNDSSSGESNKTANQSADVDVVEHNFVGAPVTVSRHEIGSSQTVSKTSDDSSRQSIESVADDNDAGRNQGEPDENHQGQDQQSDDQEESEE